ncbi:glycoside hydrolase family 2 TIM barrel-domain containing protein [uncultured Algibacter sp.]|uniref:glycoside hydrolase family 2 TIM barrel-domain containing protein n=1 Tax=uncultured Algibacter sp. TaxID=298659 RepID=UPI002601A5ED|nr:glycoside hydrolase family 2 TIM barrel-domain containing protein [uncultured Algibacter sp.]
MKIIKSIFTITLLFFIFSCENNHQTTEKILFDFDWKFAKGAITKSEVPEFNDSSWKSVNLPHDWSIEGPFSKENKSFSRGGWLPTGKCTYRKTFNIPSKDKNKRIAIYFDGAYRNSEVWINGAYLGKRPLGYIAFHYDLTKHIKYGSNNTITVKLDNSSQPGSRWYTGTGIYRHVYLIKSDKLHIPIWGTYINTNTCSSSMATLHIETEVQNSHSESKEFKIKYTIYSPLGKIVKTKYADGFLKEYSSSTNQISINIENPELWNPETPNQYRVKTELIESNNIVYSEITKTGIRNIEFNSDTGFNLNGKNIKLKGVCLHHDGGPLGAAVYRRTIERQLEILKEMGCNAVRTAHNPFSEEFLDVCDEMGFLVMNEMFDEWELPKSPMTTQEGKKVKIPVDFYAKEFKKWANIDLTDFILRDRNHPSVIMWSIGNEIEQMMNETGAPIAKRLSKIVHDLDYRPVTNGVYGYGWNRWPNEEAVSFSDVKGYNYILDEGFDIEKTQFPNAKAIVTECASAQSFYPRNTYLYGKEKEAWWNNLNYTTNDAFNWAERRDIRSVRGIDAWKAVKKRKHVMGQFIWTGFDYLGEVIPFGWPARSSSFAPIDLCGFPKDGFYFYQSQWTEKPMVHIFPHWNLKGQEGKNVKVYAFTNGDEIELFQDGKSLGKQKNDINGVEYQSWDVKYTPGTLKALSYKNGELYAEQVINTAGKADNIEIFTRRTKMQANSQDLIYIEFTINDSNGNMVPNANNQLNFSIEGPASIVSVGNGNNMSHEPFQSNKRKAFNGKCLAIIKSTNTPGEIKFTVSSYGLKSSSITLNSN